MEIAEILFDSAYLVAVLTMGFILLMRSNGREQVKLFGIMALILGFGDSFHLFPRIYALSTDGLQNHRDALGFGTFVASISMTVFYVILYHIAKIRYSLKDGFLTLLVYGLASIRILLCLCPDNKWTSEVPSYSWEIYRNIPFLMLGIVIIILFWREARKNKDKVLRWMWLAIVLSFAFYIPVVIWSKTFPGIGVLMIPKTIAYVWMVVMAMNLLKSETSFEK